MKYKAVLFDFDGTIADTDQLIMDSWQHTYNKVLGHDGDQEFILRTFGATLRNGMISAFPDLDPEETMTIYKNYQLSLDEDSWYLYPGVKEMIEALKAKGIRIGVVTSRAKQTCLIGLNASGLEPMVDALVTCDDTQSHKPDPEAAQICMRELGVEAEDCIMVGDTKYDVGCGINAGVDTVLVRWPKYKKFWEDSEFQPDHFVDTTEELLDLICQE